jgi:hypothetical protein
MRYKIPAAFYFGALRHPGLKQMYMKHKTAPYVGVRYGGLGNYYLDTLYVTEFRQVTYKKCLHK